MARKLVETRKRGFFGYLMLTVFWLANLFMAGWLVTTWYVAGKEPHAVEAGIVATGMLMTLWFFVVVVTGMLVFVTRGRKEITEMEI